MITNSVTKEEISKGKNTDFGGANVEKDEFFVWYSQSSTCWKF